MTQQEYEQKKRECFVRFCKDNGIDQEVNISIFDAFDQIFDRAFALGKQFGNPEQVDAEGEEILTVSRKRVRESTASKFPPSPTKATTSSFPSNLSVRPSASTTRHKFKE